MNDIIDNMVAEWIVLVKVIIYSETDESNEACFGAFQPRAYDFLEGKLSYPDVGVMLNFFCIIKSKGRFQCAGVQPENKTRK